MTADGIIQAFWKPVGWTSFDVVKRVRGHVRLKKVGHAGTLDPFAEGILVICFGAATKQVESLMGLEKVYEADIMLGVMTDTLDLTGTVAEEAPVPELDVEDVEAALRDFIGEIEQIPPMYSALKVNGKRLYELARKGEVVERSPRKVTIKDITLEQFDQPNKLTLVITCGRGTYIRVLADDLARALGTVGHLTRLVRTRVGPYDASNVIHMEHLAQWNPIAN